VTVTRLGQVAGAAIGDRDGYWLQLQQLAQSFGYAAESAHHIPPRRSRERTSETFWPFVSVRRRV